MSGQPYTPRVAVFYVGSSLLSPLKAAERDLRTEHLSLKVDAYNCGLPLDQQEWEAAKASLSRSDAVLVVHLTDDENARYLEDSLAKVCSQNTPIIVLNCLPRLMRLTRLGRLDLNRILRPNGGLESRTPAMRLIRRLNTWMAGSLKAGTGAGRRVPASSYLKLVHRVPALLRFLPGVGALRDLKNYLTLYSYFLQPTPTNIRSLLTLLLKYYVRGCASLPTPPPAERQPTVGIYHPQASCLFTTFEAYRKWYEGQLKRKLEPQNTVGLLLMRPQVVSESRQHYDGLIQAIEAQSLAVIPALSTLMDSREACLHCFVDGSKEEVYAWLKSYSGTTNGRQEAGSLRPRVSQVISLTGFSFVGGPASNDCDAAAAFFKSLNVPFHSLVSLDVQTIENWELSRVGLNPVQTAMQVAIPELDGGIEPFVFGGIRHHRQAPEPLADRVQLIAARLKRWNRLQTAARRELKLAFLVYCFPPGKGNLGTAAGLDVFPSLLEILRCLKSEGYEISLPMTGEEIRDRLLGGNSTEWGTIANVAYRMTVDEYRQLCPWVEEVESEWGRPPGRIHSNGREILVLGAHFGNVFVGVQPTFGYEGDPMRLLAAQGGAPHHGYMGLYTYLRDVWQCDAVVHVGTHGATEFMPGKQVGLSSNCWPDRLIRDLPNLYLYSVNNPSEGTIARRRSAAELISYLTPPVQNAGLYKELATLKDLLTAYRQAQSDLEREHLFAMIEENAAVVHLV
ncbi:MAG: cobaltochelatase subunit CobN [Acidobacteriota bacterium]